MKKNQRSRKQIEKDLPVKELLAWYLENRRDLPWRGQKTPYAVWVSEIMLQQTRIETVRGYFLRFMQAFPTVRDLAKAPLDDVLKLWEGLGYYSRARNLKTAAEQVVFRGHFPDSSGEWSRLPGIGPYTAAALASICNGEPAPVVDGNVGRVVARFRAAPLDPKNPKTRASIADWLRPAIEASHAPGDFNEAMMELGETICLPSSPSCPLCPFRKNCRSFLQGETSRYPAKTAPRTRPVRHFIALIVQSGPGRFFLHHRPEHGLLGGLWEVPSVESAPSPTRAAVFKSAEDIGIKAPTWNPAGEIIHDFTHFRQILHVWLAAPGAQTKTIKTYIFANPENLALSTASKRALELVKRKIVSRTS